MNLLKRILKSILQIIAAFIVIGIVGAVWMFYEAGRINKKVNAMAARIHVGMTVPELVEVFPEDYFMASVLSLRRTASCRTAKGEILPPENSEDKLAVMTAEPHSQPDVDLSPCPPITFISVHRASADGSVQLDVHSYDVPTSKLITLTKDEFAQLLQRDFQGRGFGVSFTYQDGLPHHVSFGIDFGADGKVAAVQKPYAWD